MFLARSVEVMNAFIDNRVLRMLDGPGCASYFHRLRQHGLSEVAITGHLLNAVQSQSVPLLPISVWLSFAQSPMTIKIALDQTFSLRTRTFAIQGFGRLLGRERWMLLWSEFGGIEGILDLFSQLSICEIDFITKIIGHHIVAGKDTGRDAFMSDLLRALLGVGRVDAGHKNPDHRYLVGKYLEILPACDGSFVEEMLCRKVTGVPDHEWQLKHFRSHSALIARLTMKSAFESGHLPARTFEGCLSFCLKNLQLGFSTERGCSMSMSFALEILKRLAEDKRSNLPVDEYLHQLYETLMNPSWRKRKLIGLSRLASLVDMSLSCLSSRPNAVNLLSTGPGSLLHWVVRCWSFRPEMLNDALHNLLEKCSSQITAQNVTSVAKPLLRTVETELRYGLLHKLFKSTSGLSIDIDSMKELAKSNDLWDHEIFTILPRKFAVPLLERLRQVKPELGLSLPYGNSSMQTCKTIILCPATPMSNKADTNFLYHTLRRGQEGALESANKFLTQQKQTAVTFREQTDRAFYARSSLFAALASGSSELLKDTIIWLRRYIRDPLTIKTLFDETTFKMTELIDLLAGIPETPSKQNSHVEVAEAVSAGNVILKEVYETVCQALREPSFYAPDWQGPLTLFRSVAETRLDRVRALQQVLRLSDEQLYDTVWKDTLQMLATVEESALEDGSASLKFGGPLGPLCYRGMGDTDSKKSTPASYRFVDHLAQTRDDLWKGVRRWRTPSVTALPDPWPRGLPIQHLVTSLDVAHPSAKGYTAYLSARAKTIVFTPAVQALAELPKDEDSRTAIGTHIDDYNLALKIYVLQEPSPDKRKHLVNKAWKHAIQFFTRTPMTDNEKIRYVQLIFRKALPGYDLPLSSIDHAKLQSYPILPDHTDTEDSTEWNPFSTRPPDITEKKVPLRVIDCLASKYSADRLWSAESFARLGAMLISIPGWSAPPIWSLERFKPKRAPREVREAMIISRLLYLDSRIGGRSRLLARPFPSLKDTRYPPLFLDSEFLLREDLGTLDLRSFTAHVAVSLVRSLADGAMEQLLLQEDRVKKGEGKEEATLAGSESTLARDALTGGGTREGRSKISHEKSISRDTKPTTISPKSRIAELERVLYDLVALLAASDKPQSAAHLILRIILDRPDASSWHRKLLSIKYLQCLPSADVQVLFSDFVRALSERLAEQDAHRDDKDWKGKYVKTTTLKYVAQLLNGADFISRINAVDILVNLFHQSKHIDVRVAAVESMLGMLTPCRNQADEPVANAVIEGLKATIPLIGGPSERRQTTENDWLEAKTTGILPEVGDDKPIANLLIEAVADRIYSIDLRYRSMIMREVLVPALAASALTNERWVRLFASQNGVDLGPIETHHALLKYPIKPSMISALLQLCPKLTPAHILQKYHNHVLALINLPSGFTTLNSKIQSTLDLRTSSSGKTFSSLYKASLHQHRDASVYFTLLRGQWTPSLLPHDGITLETLQKMVCDLAPEFIAHYDEQPEHFDIFASHLQPPFHLSAESRQNWTANIKPILSGVVFSIDEARARLRAGELSTPAVLPDTFGMALWLLPWPTSRNLTSTTEVFTASVVAVLEDLAAGDPPLYHAKYVQLRDMLLRIPNVELHVQIALELGDRLGARSTLCRALVEELQERLLVGVSGSTVQAEVLGMVEGVARRWVEDGDEETRRRGFAVKRAAEKAKAVVRR